jgi:hypothetical protein
MRSALWPLVLVWLALHAALLALFLCVRFLGVKMAILGALLLGAVWLLARQSSRLMPLRRMA